MANRGNNAETVPVKSLKKALELLSILLFEDAEGKGFELKVLAGRLGIPANSAHNLLKTMVICGYAERNGYGHYTFGTVCRQIAFRNAQSNLSFREYALEVIRHMVGEIRETAVLITLENNVWTSLMRVGRDGKLQKNDTETVRRYYLYESATGRVIFAFSRPAQRRILRRENGPPEIFWPEYRNDVKKIRAEGFCASFRKRYRSFGCAVPVFDGNHDVIAALGVFASPDKLTPVRRDFILEQLRKGAERLSRFREESF